MYLRTSLRVALLLLAMMCPLRPASAQDAKACVNEVDRLSSSFSMESGNDNAIAQRPSARQGTSLKPEQHKPISDVLQQARAAGESAATTGGAGGGRAGGSSR
jgi:hypothetical protein